jgi:4-hydroxy-3-polyprenylbenzoate decarboxylase
MRSIQRLWAVGYDGRDMCYRHLRACLDDLERARQLRRIPVEIDAHLEAAEIQRRVYAAGGPALLFERVKGCRFPMVSNLFGTIERTRFMFRDTLDLVQRLVELKVDPSAAARRPFRYARALPTAWAMRPKFVSRGAVLEQSTTIDQLPPLQSWPLDGGPFVTLPAVYTEHPDHPGWQRSNLGMYRVQLSGNDYERNREVGLHYQIHRSIGVHHAAAVRRGEPLRVNVFVGGPPALMLSAVMPLPEGLSELTFAGALGGRRVAMVRPPVAEAPGSLGLPIAAEADFCLVGTIDPQAVKPEGPFGDHLGYYSLSHPFPVMRVERVYHRRDAVWPFTVVGRPPQEDTSFGALIHEITGPVIPSVLPGVKGVHAVDAAGVHPLLLAIGSERYVPYAGTRRPQELLTQANAILGQGQLSLAKYLLIVADQDDPRLDIHDIPAFLRHLLERVDWRTDLHFQTQTTIDTLDYSGHGLNAGSKLVIAAAGPRRRELPTSLPSQLTLPEGFRDPRLWLPGIVAVTAPRCAGVRPAVEVLNWASSPGGPVESLPHGGAEGTRRPDGVLERFCRAIEATHPLAAFPLVVLVDDAAFTAESLHNFLWVTFTRSNPAADIDGVGAFTADKHWGCRGPLVIDARIKPHHAPPLVEDPAVSRRVDALAAPGGPLHGLF